MRKILISTIACACISSANMSQNKLNDIFNNAQSEVKKENYKKAKDLYIQILNEEPSNARVKLELAHVYFKLNKLEKSKKLFTQVLSLQNIPKQVHNNAQKFLEIVNNKIKDKLKFQVTLGYKYDSNPASDTFNNTVDFINTSNNTAVPVTISPSSKSDQAKIISFSGTNKYYIDDKYTFSNSISFASVKYNEETAYDTMSYGLTSNLSNKLDKATNISLPIIVNQNRLNDEIYNTQYSISPNLVKQIGKNKLLQGSLKISRNNYTDNTKDSNSLELSIASINKLNENIEFIYGGLISKEKASTNSNSNKSATAYIQFSTKLPSNEGLESTNILIMNKKTTYDEVQFIPGSTVYTFNDVREDNLLYLSCGLTLENGINIKYNRSINESKANLYDYKKNELMINYTINF